MADSLKSFVSGGIGGVLMVAVSYPFDLAKVRLQTSNTYNGVADCLKRTVRTTGLRGLYKGASVTLLSSSPINAVCFWGYDVGQRLVRRTSGLPAGAPLTALQHGAAGAFTALPTVLFMAPMDIVKVLLQADKAVPKRFNGPIHAATVVVNEGGVQALFRGVASTLSRDVFGYGTYFGVYEATKRALSTGDTATSPLAIMVSGSAAGAACWSVCLPLDTIKSRVQVDSTLSAVACVRQIMRTEGVLGFYRGYAAAMLRAVPANAAVFLGVETSMKLLNLITF